MPHPVVHTEIRSNDPDATRKFFADLLGFIESDDPVCWVFPPGVPAHINAGAPGMLDEDYGSATPSHRQRPV